MTMTDTKISSFTVEEQKQIVKSLKGSFIPHPNGDFQCVGGSLDAKTKTVFFLAPKKQRISFSDRDPVDALVLQIRSATHYLNIVKATSSLAALDSEIARKIKVFAWQQLSKEEKKNIEQMKAEALRDPNMLLGWLQAIEFGYLSEEDAIKFFELCEEVDREIIEQVCPDFWTRFARAIAE